MKKKLSLFVMCLLISTSLCYAVLSRNDVENLLLSSIVSDRIGQVDVYLYDELIPLNENVACAGFSILSPYNSNWVAFIDEAPGFGWTHPCTYVFIDNESGQYLLHQDQHPINNLRDFEKISTIEYIANSEIIPSIEYNDLRPTNDHIYAVLINGVNTSGSELWFWNELSAMFTTLVHEYGTPRDHIKVLSTDATNANNFVFNHEGIQYRGRDLDFRRESSTPSNDIQYSCTTSNLTSVFTSLGNELGSDDVVYVYLTGHGEVGNDQFIFRTWDNDMILASEFNSLLDNLNDCKQVAIVATGCKSGYLINGSVPITGHNRTIVTSCNMLEDEHAEVWITPVPNDPSGFSLTSGYGEFAYYFISALRGKYPARENIGDNDAILINQPWANGPLVGSYNFPMAPPPPSPHPADIDYRYLRENYWNNSGEPLLFRAYQYADIWNTMSDQELMEEGLALLTNQPNYLMVHPSISPAYRTHPQYHSNGCLYRDRQTLDNVNLNLNGYEIRDRLSFYDQPISLIGSLSVSGSEACLNLEDNSTLIMTPSSEISVVYGRIDVNHSIVTMQTSAVLNLEKASATFDHSRLNMNSSSINMRRYWYPDSSSSILFTNNSLLHAVSGANGNSQITGNAPATYVENVVNAGTNYANHIGSETLVRGDFVEFRNSIFETYGSDTHRFRIKSNQTQDPDNPTFWDGVYFYDCEQDFIDNPFQYVNFEYLDKISFNNCDFTLDHCNFSNSGQLVVENNSSVQVVGSSYSTNDGPIYVSHSAIDIQSSQINNNRLGGVYLNYPRTSQGNNWISDSTISNNGLHGIRTSNCFLNLLRTSITNNDGQGLYNFSIVTSRIMNGVHLGDNAGAEIFSTDVGFPIFYAPLDNDNIVNQIIDDNYIEDSLDKFYLMALGAPQDGSIHLLNTSLNHNNPERFYPSINCFTFYDTLLPASRILANAMTLLAANEYPACMDSLKHILDIYPDTKEAKTALGLLPYVDKALNSDNTSLIQYLDNLSDEFLDDAIIDSKILSFIYKKDYISAINNLESIIQNPPSDYKLLAAMLDEAYCYYLSTIEGKGNVLECTVMPKNRVDYNTICADLQNQLNEFSDVEYSNQSFVNNSIEVSNYPNPFNPTTTLSFSLPAEMVCNLEIYNVRGQKVKTLLNENRMAGRHSVVWDGKDANGRSVSSGVYFYRLTTPNRTHISKMLLMK